MELLLKRNGAARQREEWHLDIFRAKAVKVYDVPQEELEKGAKSFQGASIPNKSIHL